MRTSDAAHGLWVLLRNSLRREGLTFRSLFKTNSVELEFHATVVTRTRDETGYEADVVDLMLRRYSSANAAWSTVIKSEEALPTPEHAHQL